ncbi:MAG TPA: D-glycero-beta-D-manno-heptose 1-phosphate adenylyltransferase [Candidatus Limnocylindrales bacterium]|nr:D-glycero-beta-D-manno-heptose 1-phosphate adenylyltransferase [Candidatus Limnocylindrales bacterium]
MTPVDGRSTLLDRFASLRVLVVGEAILDGYLDGVAGRISREAPVPIVELNSRSDVPGGAANTAHNLAALGARVRFLSVVGEDEEGERLLDALRVADVDVAAVARVPGRRTLAKQRISAGGQMLLRFDTGSTDPIDAAYEDRLIGDVLEAWPAIDAVVISDYGYGVVSDRLLAVLGERQRHDPRVVVADARDLRRYRPAGVTAVKPNFGEACRLLGEPEERGSRPRAAQAGMAGERLLERTGARIVALTVDQDGAFVFERGAPPYRTYATPHPSSRAAGAGDTFVSAFALAIAAEASAPAAAELASAAAGVVVRRNGTSTCSLAELRDALAADAGKRVSPGPALEARLAAWRDEDRRIVFTNGVFDILHRGHVAYLARAKGLGDVLVVAVNTDASVHRLKGPSRPINGLDDRIAVLEALSPVDLVVPFDEDTPERLIEQVRPHVFVKGGDYRRETLPEVGLVERLGGSVRILPFTEDRSTSGVIERVREAYGTAAR